MIRVGIIGAGAWGKNHVRTLARLETAELVAVADASADVRGGLQKQYPRLRTFAEAKQLVEWEGVDAVVVATPSSTHAAIAQAAIDKGKHLLVEKPLSLANADAEKLVESARRQKRVLMVGHLMLFHPAVLRLKQMIDQGELGDLLYLYSERVNLGVIRQDENALWSLGPHDLSVTDFIVGQRVIDVTARGEAFFRPEIHDVVFVSVRFDGGVMANIHVSWLNPHKSRRIVVVGSRKMAVLDDMQAQEKLRIYDKGADWVPTTVGYGEYLTVRSGDIVIPKLEMTEPLRAQAEHFIECITHGRTPRSDGEHGLRVLRLLTAAQTSLDSGGRPVDVDATGVET